jgi:hypothetical protein
MSEEEKTTEEVVEPQDSNLEEELVLDLEEETEQGEGSEAEVDWKQKASELEAKNKQLFARLKKGEQKTEKPQDNSSSDVVDVKDAVKKLQMAENKRQFGYEHNLSPDEVDAIFKINPNPDASTLKDPFVRGGIQMLRAKKRVENATPSTSRTSTTINGKSWSELSTKEKEQNFDKFRQNFRKK